MWSKKQNMWFHKTPKKPYKAKKRGFYWLKSRKTLFAVRQIVTYHNWVKIKKIFDEKFEKKNSKIFRQNPPQK